MLTSFQQIPYEISNAIAILIGTKRNLHTLKTLTIHHASLKEVKEEIQR